MSIRHTKGRHLCPRRLSSRCPPSTTSIAQCWKRGCNRNLLQQSKPSEVTLPGGMGVLLVLPQLAIAADAKSHLATDVIGTGVMMTSALRSGPMTTGMIAIVPETSSAPDALTPATSHRIICAAERYHLPDDGADLLSAVVKAHHLASILIPTRGRRRLEKPPCIPLLVGAALMCTAAPRARIVHLPTDGTTAAIIVGTHWRKVYHSPLTAMVVSDLHTDVVHDPGVTRAAIGAAVLAVPGIAATVRCRHRVAAAGHGRVAHHLLRRLRQIYWGWQTQMMPLRRRGRLWQRSP